MSQVTRFEPVPWVVYPHGKFEKLLPNLWTVEGSVPRLSLKRRMTVIRLQNGDLVIHSAVALDEAGMKELEAFGRPAILIVPNGFHRMDAPRYKSRYPQLKVLCPAESATKVQEVVPVDGHYDTFPADPEVRVETLDGLKGGEAVVIVRHKQQTALVFNDVLFNHPHLPGFGGWLMKLLGSTGGPRVTRVARLLMIRQPAALRAHLLRLADLANVSILVAGHGDPVLTDAATVLRSVASGLG